MFDAIKTSEENLEKVAFAHDTSRVLQSCLQHGSAEQRRFIYTELKAKIPEMAQSKYARNVVLKLIKYGERDIKDHCIENMGNVRKLVRSAIGQVSGLLFDSFLTHFNSLLFRAYWNMHSTSLHSQNSDPRSFQNYMERVGRD